MQRFLAEHVPAEGRYGVHDVKRSESGEILFRPGFPAASVVFQIVRVIHDLKVKIPPGFFPRAAFYIDGAGKNVHPALRLEPCSVRAKDSSLREPEPEGVRLRGNRSGQTSEGLGGDELAHGKNTVALAHFPESLAF